MRAARKKWKQRFKDLSLKKKLLILYSVLFILPLLLISVLIYAEVSGSMTEKIRFSAQHGYEQAKSYLEYKVVQLIQRTDVVATNSSLKSMVDPENAAQSDSHQQLAQKEIIRSYLQSVESSNQNLRLQIYISDGFSLLSDGAYILSFSDADESQWYREKGDRRIYFAPGAYLEEGKQDGYFALVRDIPPDDDYRKRSCVLRMDVGISELEEILQNAAPTENAVSYLINQSGILVSVSDGEKLRALGLDGELSEALSYSKAAADGSFLENSLGGKTVYYLRSKIRNTDWEMITVIPEYDMTSGIARLQSIVIALLLLFGLLTISGGTAIVSWIVRRISRLNDSFNQVKAGDMEVSLRDGSSDEIGVLCDNYSDMIATTRELMDEKVRMGVSLKSAELKALQSQINPHFLYNTLDLVNWLAFAGRTQDIHETVVSLSKYYRLILNKGQDTLTLAEELRHVRCYVKIQDIRFPGRLTYEEQVDEAVLDSIVPKILLQPLVENAIQHGIWEKRDKRGVVRVTGREEDGVVCLRVEDDGAGMDAETLQNVMDGKRESSGSSYGVKNVDARLKLTFGEPYGLSFESVPGRGTRVTVRFPHRTASSPPSP